MTDSPSFFENKVPQSEYRRRDPNVSRIRQPIHLELTVIPKLKLADRLALRAKIEEETDLVIHTLLPESKWALVDREALLRSIFERLGIS